MSQQNEAIELNDKVLQKLLKALKSVPEARVGILAGGKEKRRDQSSNATIGAAHEFGTSELPQRSFLRQPITDHLQNKLAQAGAFDEEKLREVIRSGTLSAWVQKIAVTAEGIVAEAFASGGFGKWKPSDMTDKKVKMTLVETQQLRNSISSEVKET